MFLINGLEQNTLAVTDRATQFGDGSFTTARIVEGRVQQLAAHIGRLQLACERLSIAFSDWQILAQEMSALASEQRDGVLKVIISRGPGGRGFTHANSLYLGDTSPLYSLEGYRGYARAQPGNAGA